MYGIPLQFDRPLFIRVPFTSRGRKWKKNEHFPWKEIGIDSDKVHILYTQGFLIHNEDYESKMNIGDGLETLDIPGLHSLVDEYNKRIKAVSNNNTAFLNKKMKKSKLADKQRGLIRSWRRNFEDWLTKAEANKKG